MVHVPACWISKATCTYACAQVPTHTQKYVTVIAFPQQQRFCESASMLHYTYIAPLVRNKARC
jgi:hypothetical protein